MTTTGTRTCSSPTGTRTTRLKSIKPREIQGAAAAFSQRWKNAGERERTGRAGVRRGFCGARDGHRRLRQRRRHRCAGCREQRRASSAEKRGSGGKSLAGNQAGGKKSEPGCDRRQNHLGG